MKILHNYGTSLDAFSFGHVALCVGNHCELNIVLPSVGVTSESSVKRRRKYLNSFGPKHCIYSLEVNCLQDSPHKRPIAKNCVIDSKDSAMLTQETVVKQMF